MLLDTNIQLNPSPDQLRQGPYILVEELEHDQIMAFVQEYAKKLNLFAVVFWLFNIVILGWIGVLLSVPSSLSVLSKLSFFATGMLLFLVILLPIHELIHAAVYKLQGARRISIEAQWRKLIFLALADNFVVNARQFYLLALAPFVVITGLLLFSSFLVGDAFQWVLYGALLFHTSGCIGDFALCSFLYENKHLTLYTYDDYQAKKSYFYAEAERTIKED